MNSSGPSPEKYKWEGICESQFFVMSIKRDFGTYFRGPEASPKRDMSGKATDIFVYVGHQVVGINRRRNE